MTKNSSIIFKLSIIIIVTIIISEDKSNSFWNKKLKTNLGGRA